MINIAEKLRRDKGTISRGRKRNRDSNRVYHAEKAEKFACNRCKRKRFHNFTDSAKSIIEEKLIIHWTPEHISAELKNTYAIYARSELIYQYLAFDREQGGIGTFVDIKTKYLIIRKVNDKSSMKMKNAMVNGFKNYPDIVQTLTLDNGTEFTLHDQMEKELDTQNLRMQHDRPSLS